MEDYIKREIDKIGKLLQAILQKIGVMKKSDDSEAVYRETKTELLEKLNVDLDTLLEQDDFIDILIKDYGFSDENLEKFAELLFDMVIASPDEAVRIGLAANISTIYKYLDKHSKSISINRFYILKELEKFI